jgi:hypothetical protein
MTSATPKQALDAAMDASRYLQGLRMDPRRALRIIEPYAACGLLVGATPAQSLRVRSIIHAVIADCYRELGEVTAAAEWYRSASQNWKVGGFPGFYADMVITHRLADHYETALECLKVSQESWRARPLLMRLYYHVTSCWWLYPSMWRILTRERGFVPRLEALIRDRAASG